MPVGMMTWKCDCAGVPSQSARFKSSNESLRVGQSDGFISKVVQSLNFFVGFPPFWEFLFSKISKSMKSCCSFEG